MKFWLKQCPRCLTGDLHEVSDIYGSYIACVQCGYIPNAFQEALLLAAGHNQEECLPEKVAA